MQGGRSMKRVLALILTATLLLGGCVSLKCPGNSQSQNIQPSSSSSNQQQPPALSGLQPGQPGNISGLQPDRQGDFSAIQPTQQGSLPGLQPGQQGSLPGLQPSQQGGSSGMAGIKAPPRIQLFYAYPATPAKPVAYRTQYASLNAEPGERNFLLVFHVEGADSVKVNDIALSNDDINKGYKIVYPGVWTTGAYQYVLKAQNANGTAEAITALQVADDKNYSFNPNESARLLEFILHPNGKYIIASTYFCSSCTLRGDGTKPGYPIRCNTYNVIEVVPASKDKYLELELKSPNDHAVSNHISGVQLKP